MTKPRWYVNQSQSGRFYCAPCWETFNTQGITRSGRRRTLRITVTCGICGKALERYLQQVATNKGGFFCPGACGRAARIQGLRARHALQVRELDRWHNGYKARLDCSGYVLVYEPGSNGRHRTITSAEETGWCFEHRLVAEQKIGRKLAPGEHVHHINGIKTDNRPENLQVLSQQAHRKLHNDQIAEKLARLADYERRFGPLDTDRAVEPQPTATAPLRDLKTEGVH